MLNDNNFFSGGSESFYPKEIEQSLRFNDNDSAYLSWTPASAGNRKTWTWSGWVKRGNIVDGTFLSLGTTLGVNLRWSSDTLQSNILTVGSTTSSSVYRDPSAWYHIVLAFDTTEASNNDRLKLYVNGSEVTYSANATLTLNGDYGANSTTAHYHGCEGRGGTPSSFADNYFSETHFIDGTALDASSFGEFKNGVWIPKAFTGSYGTNGFYLPYNNDYTVEGFSATTYRGTEIDNTYIGGVGFEPDLVWIKRRNAAADHSLSDSVRGTGKYLVTNNTSAELTGSEKVNSFDTDGFTISTGWGINQAGYDYVAWCWDAGTGSPVSNTDGTITSTVKASTDYGFSVVSYTGTGSAATVGHGLSSVPEMIIVKGRDNGDQWFVYHTGTSGTPEEDYLYLNLTNAALIGGAANVWNDTAPTTSVFSLNGDSGVNGSALDYIAYCFHSVAGYSDFGSYTGTGASGNTVTTGFRPAFVMVKNTSDATFGDWHIFDTTRNPSAFQEDRLEANTSDAEAVGSSYFLGNITDTGFEITNSSSHINQSGSTFIYMAFADTREAAFWLDQSGNNNDWENNGLTESDISLDSPTNNFATLNPLRFDGSCTFSEGNLEAALPADATATVVSTFGVNTGKYYWEVFLNDPPNGTNPANMTVGVTDVTEPETTMYNYNTGVSYGYNGNKNVDGTNSAYGSSVSVDDIIGVALNCDDGEVTFYLNNVSQGAITLPYTSDTVWQASVTNNTSGDNCSFPVNFGQDSSFAGNKTPQGYTDANGRGDFYYAPPAGYLALCTANLPEPAIGPNSATTSDEHFNTVLWTGTATSNGQTQAVTGVGFQPDFLWIKARSNAASHYLADSIRGANKSLLTNATNAEITDDTFGHVNSLDADGFTTEYSTNGGLQVNASGQTYVAWNWKADNTSGSSNTDGSITSTVSANVDAGFSIVGYTGTGAVATVGHGLNSAPEMVIVKNRDTSTTFTHWGTYVASLGATKHLNLNTTDAAITSSTMWNDTEPTSSVFTVGTQTKVNNSGDAMIAYCFHSVEGFSKFGSYTGNGSTDGPFVYTGFRPAFVMIKGTSTTRSWEMTDSERDTYNVADSYLYADTSGTENTFDNLDLLSNGFKLRQGTGGTGNNTSGVTYIYMAFAENPFKYSNAR